MGKCHILNRISRPNLKSSGTKSQIKFQIPTAANWVRHVSTFDWLIKAIKN